MKTDRFQGNVSNKLLDNFNLNEGLNTVGNTLSSIFGKQPIENTTIIQEAPKPKEDDNTMLYVGLGGAALLVILLIVFLR